MGGLRKPGAAMRELQDPRVAERERLRFALTDAAKHLDEFETRLKRSTGVGQNKSNPSFLIDSPTLKTTVSKKLRTSTMAFAAVALFICGYAASIFGVLESWPVKVFGFDAKQQHQSDVLAHDLAAAREEIGLHIRRENAAQAAALETKRIAVANQNELKQALDAKTAELDKLARDLAAEISVSSRRVDYARAEALRLKQISETNERELKKALDENVARADELQRELSARVVTDKLSGVSDKAQEGGSEPVNSQMPNTAPVIGTRPNVESPDVVATETTAPPSGPSAPISAPLNHVDIGIPQPSPQPGRTQPTIAISSEEEARLLARAEFLIEQSDIASARLLLEHGREKGSIRAIFMLAETYENRTSRPLQAYRIHSDAEKAVELYGLAAGAGMAEARERLEALTSGTNR
jgi:TPR repeat protein